MYIDEIVQSQKRGEAKGITSICSAHPDVIKQMLKVSQTYGISPLIEATCNQVNQFGGYTGMTPKKFVAYVRGLAEEVNFPLETIILGGDHLGPNVWQNEPAESAMQKSSVMIKDYVQAGFVKIHLDCSMKLGDDLEGLLDIEVSAKRAAQLAGVAELSIGAGLVPAQLPRYIIGTEVPIPGGAHAHEESVSVTNVADVQQTIQITKEAFYREGLQSAWERVIGVVVQPGVEFGDDFVLGYQSEKAKELSKFIESQEMIYEAHSTDYQTKDALKTLVSDHFAILKVGPALTFAFREAVFALVMIENELIAKDTRSNIMQVLDEVMLKHPEHWKKYYRGDENEQAFKRRFSLSDRMRYYWVQPEVQDALKVMMKNLGNQVLPYALLSQFVGEASLRADEVVARKINNVLQDYLTACSFQRRFT